MSLVNLIQPPGRKLLGLILPLVLVGGLVAASQVFLALTREERPLPSTPIAIHQRDCLWIIDGDTDTVTHGPFCFSDLWRTVGIGDIDVAPGGYLYVSFSYEQILDKVSAGGETVLVLDTQSNQVLTEIPLPSDK